jgi:hypothetical protein
MKKKKKASADSESSDTEKYWSREKALSALNEVVAVSIEAAKNTESKFNSQAANAATKAIEIANKIMGYGSAGSEESGEDESSLTVEFSGDEELAE